MLLADGADTVLPANPLQRGLLAPLRMCRRWQNPDRCPPGGDTRGGPGLRAVWWGPAAQAGVGGQGGSGSQTAIYFFTNIFLAKQSLEVRVERQKRKNLGVASSQGRGK